MTKDAETGAGLNRRDFIKVAGIGAAALAMPHVGFAANAGQRSIEDISQDEVETDVLIIGGGYAGVFAALNAKKKGVNVTLVDKGTIFKSGLTPFARGFSHFDKKTQDPEILQQYSLMIGEYLGNRPYLQMYIDLSEQVHNNLKEWGVYDSRSNFPNIFRNQVINAGINIIEKTMITNLIKQDGKVVGAVGFPVDKDKATVIKAKAVVLCSGAGSFKAPGFFANSITHDGDAMAYRIGAAITGKEFQDTHGTRADYPAASFLGWQGMLEGTNPTAIVVEIENNLTLAQSFNAHTQGAYGEGRPERKNPGGGIIWGSPENLKIERGVPGSTSTHSARPEGMRGGARPPRPEQTGGASAGLAAHKSEGLWAIDDKCSSTIPGLFAAGDALGSRMCGGLYSLGGGSSSGSAVQGLVAGESAAVYAKKTEMPKVSQAVIKKIKDEIFGPRGVKEGYSPDWMIQLIQNAMIPYYVLYVKKADRLQAALTNIKFYQEHFMPHLTATDTHDLRLAHEVKNMLLNAEMKLKASLFRTESRATHYREDYPARNDKDWLAWVVISNENGKMTLKKVPIPEENKPDPKVPYVERYPIRFPGELDYIKENNIS
jgi:succinate dehydrogenase/fumarate reductase flavoprotein subunit